MIICIMFVKLKKQNKTKLTTISFRVPKDPSSQQINKFPPKRVKNPATPSSIFISSSSTGELCSQPVRGNVRQIGRMFPEHVERSFLDLEYTFDEYSQLGSWRKVCPIKNQLGSQTNIHPVKNRL